MKSLDELFLHLLKDMYFAEKQLTKALPKMAKEAQSGELKRAFNDHLKETKDQIDRLDLVFKEIGKQPRGEKCEAIIGLIDEAKEVMEDSEDPALTDAGLIASAQAVEHYEIARYGTLISWAGQLGLRQARNLLQQNLDEEKAADKKLSALAEQKINLKAA